MSTPSVTPNIGLQIPATGSNNWYIPLNYDLNKIDQYLGGQIAIPNLLVTNLTVTNFGLDAADVTNALGYVPLNPANNLADVSSVAAALNNLGAIGASSIKGAWSSATTYNVGDVVFDSSITYVSVIPNNLNNDPSSSPSDWAVFINASAGAGFTSLIGDVTASGTGAVTATVVGINGVELDTLGAGILAIDASGIPALAVAGTDYIAPNTAATLSALTIHSGSNTAVINFASTLFSVLVNSTTNFTFGTFGGIPALSLSAAAATSIATNLSMGVSGVPFAGQYKVESDNSRFLSSDNTIELQIDTQFASNPAQYSFATGDLSTTIRNTNIKLEGSVTLDGVVISGTPSTGDVLTASGTAAASWQPASGAVASVFGRTGTVVATSGDYTAAQVTDAFDLTAGTVTYSGILTINQMLPTTLQVSGGATFNGSISVLGAAVVGSGGTLSATGTGTISANKINGVALSGLATGLLKNTTTTGVPSIATDGTDYLSPSTGAASVFGRHGTVVATSGDYTAAQVTNALDLSNTGSQTLLGTLVIATGKSINTPIIRDLSGTAAATLSSGQFTFPNAATFSSSITASGTVTTGNRIINNAPQTTVNGSTSGSIICSQPEQGSAWKRVIVYLNAINGSAIYTFPTAFLHLPSSSTFGGVTITPTTTQVTIATAGALTGFVYLDGF